MKNRLSPLSLLNPNKIKVLLSLGFKGYLADKGWFKAYQTKSSIDENGNPIPWVTYSFIDFIKERITSELHIFEYGSGNSTLFYAQIAGSVCSVEHDKLWFEKSSKINLPNVKMIQCDLVEGGKYSRSAVDSGVNYHVIIVDGRDRVNCCKHSVNAITEDGVIVLDDSEREKYTEAVSFLKEQGFKHIPFTGMAPGVIIPKCTSIFYKPKNCLGI